MRHLLLADDDATIRKTLERGLRANGYRVTSVGNGVQALEALRSEPFDLVVTDINMPSMDGIELLIKLLEQRPALKVIAISGGGLLPKDELLTDARLLGAVDVLEKPFGIETLLEHIERALAGSRPRTQSGRIAPATASTRVLIADDHPLVITALTNLLSRQRDLDVIGDARSYTELWEALRRTEPDVLILDIGMPQGDALEALHRIQRRHPSVRVLVLSGLPEEEYVVRVIDAGASGFAQKGADPFTLVEAVRRVARGDMFVSEQGAQALARSAAGQGPDHERLSDRELQVLRLLGEGKSVTDIAGELHLSPKTVSTYRTRLMEKMDFSSTADIIRYAVHRGLVD